MTGIFTKYEFWKGTKKLSLMCHEISIQQKKYIVRLFLLFASENLCVV